MIYKLILLFQFITLSLTFNLPLKNNINSINIIKCKICNMIIDTKYYIPENCTIPQGCPYNIKDIKLYNTDNKYIFKG